MVKMAFLHLQKPINVIFLGKDANICVNISAFTPASMNGNNTNNSMDTNKLSLSDRFVRYSVKRAVLLGMMCLLCMTAQSQIDFKLYFANNVGEVSRVSRLKEADSELSWREAPDGTIAGNRTELEPVKKMFAETRQKTRADQEIFWKMRDDNLLCFRINDGKGTSGEFEARARSGAGRGALMKNVSGYFFVNTDSKEDSIFITVNRKGCKPDRADSLPLYVVS